MLNLNEFGYCDSNWVKIGTEWHLFSIVVKFGIGVECYIDGEESNNFELKKRRN